MCSSVYKSKRIMWWSACLCVVVAASTVPVALLINHIVPSPYMDEIFHIPQAQEYCKGHFSSWDPMITTPPGLYLLSIIYSSVLRSALGFIGGAVSLMDLCSTPVLRSLNIILTMACTLVFFHIYLHLEPGTSHHKVLLKALALSWYPLHWFFNFLYYTDVGSTTAVMAMYLALVKEAYWTSSMLGFVAILFRQTNVVWIVFLACVGMMDFLEKQNSRVTDRLSIQHQAVIPPHTEPTAWSKETEFQDMINDTWSFIYQAWQQRFDLFHHFFPLTLPIIAFLSFIAYNGSIVLGAKEAHKVSPHFAQILYFGATSMLALAPIHCDLSLIKDNFWRVMALVRTGMIGCIFAGLIAALTSIHFFSYAHPYLLSDNRHYTFYIWRRVINPHWSMKYLLSIMYFYSWFSILVTLGKRERKVWVLVFCFAVAGVLVPAPLIEFRYYTIPFYFIALHTPVNSRGGNVAWLVICLQYSIVNLITMYMFLFKPFYISSSKEAQRFLW